MPEIPKCFFAFPSNPPRIKEMIEEAVKDLNQTGIVSVVPWTSLTVAGNVIIDQVCKGIDDADVFACELTYLNPNVLFELGYAISKKKKIWITIDNSIESENCFKEFELLKTIGYSRCKNAHELITNFFKDEPYKNTQTLFEQLLNFPSGKASSTPHALLYLKSSHITDSSLKITRRVSKSPISSVVDDPAEVSHQTFSWYAQQVHDAFVVISHLVSSERTGASIHNAKQALISGIAYGLGRKLLMVADAPYESPIDYKDLLFVGNTAKEIEHWLDLNLGSIEGTYLKDAEAWNKYREQQVARLGLQALSIGDPVAENEHVDLIGYFVPTSAYTEALSSRQTIFVGRKGTGKSANLYKLASVLQEDRRNHICIIKPFDYDLDGLVRVLSQKISRIESGYLIEALWKYLIYTELAHSIHEKLTEMPKHYAFSEEESDFLNFCTDHNEIINADFSTRLEEVVSNLGGVETFAPEEQKNKISEILHSKIIGQFRQTIGKVLARREKVAVLMDNLDKSWGTTPNPHLAYLLIGLLNVTQNISGDFNRDRRDKPAINFSLVIFLRSDIFSYLTAFIPEKDKISHTRIEWNDPEKLMRVIDERFVSSLENLTPDKIWEKYFVSTVNQHPVKSFIIGQIIPRPRDIVYLVKEAIAQAVNRGHAIVEEKDLLDAQKRYSQYALESLIPEYVGTDFDLETVFYEFIGKKAVLSELEVVHLLRGGKVADDKLAECLELLQKLSFLGLEVDKERFEFVFDASDHKKYAVLARRYRQEYKVDARYKINPPFSAYLGVY